MGIMKEQAGTNACIQPWSVPQLVSIGTFSMSWQNCQVSMQQVRAIKDALETQYTHQKPARAAQSFTQVLEPL